MEAVTQREPPPTDCDDERTVVSTINEIPTKPNALAGIQAERYEAARDEWAHGEQPTRTLQGPSPAPDHSAEVQAHDAKRAQWWNEGHAVGHAAGYSAGLAVYERALGRIFDGLGLPTTDTRNLQRAIRRVIASTK